MKFISFYLYKNNNKKWNDIHGDGELFRTLKQVFGVSPKSASL